MSLDLRLTTKQKQFIDATEDEVLYGGAAGGGKSYGQMIDALLYALKYKQSSQLILRRTFPELKRSLILETQMLYPNEVATYNSSDKKWTFKNGSIIEFGYCDSEGDVSQYQSAQYDVIRFDELTHFTEHQYTYLKSRLRGTKPYPRSMKSSTNPGSVGHQWVKERFIDGKEPGEVYENDYGERLTFIPAKVTDNKYLMENDPKYVLRLESLDEDTKKALLYGEWDIFEGQYFSEWSYDHHVITPFKIPRSWNKFISIDWGFNDPCAVLWHAVAPDSRVYTYREIYVNQTLASDIAAEIVELSGEEDISYTVLSPDAWQSRGMSNIHGDNIADTFNSKGVYVTRADNNRLNGWNRVREFLKDAPDGKPLWQCFSTCVNLIRTLPGLVYDDKRVEDVSDKSEDHAPESLRYGLMSRPAPNRDTSIKEFSPEWFAREFNTPLKKEY